MSYETMIEDRFLDSFVEFVKKSNISNAELARKIGFSQAFIGKVMNNKINHRPKLEFYLAAKKFMASCWACGK